MKIVKLFTLFVKVKMYGLYLSVRDRSLRKDFIMLYMLFINKLFEDMSEDQELYDVVMEIMGYGCLRRHCDATFEKHKQVFQETIKYCDMHDLFTSLRLNKQQ